MSDDSARSSLPWVMAALVVVIGGAKLEVARPHIARLLAVAIPIVPVVMGVKRLEGGDLSLERAGSVVGWATILAGELCVASGFFGVSVLGDLAPFARAMLYLAAVAALVVHTLEARRGTKARFAAFIGIAATFAVYLSTHTGKDAFGRVYVAFFVALLIGGGAGLLAGELLARAFKKA
ncbi:MAG TPA: hypothetical protein VJN18_35185 [Polyangiaceae bacterium]|nr:hypothetical protein [Polyangiaceae bacterium]